MELDEKLKKIIRDCMEDAQEYTHGKVNTCGVERWVDKVKKILADRNRGKGIYVDPKVIDFLADDDALSMDISVSKHGGTINSKRMIPYVPAYSE